jgi:hypothetical protein
VVCGGTPDWAPACCGMPSIPNCAPACRGIPSCAPADGTGIAPPEKHEASGAPVVSADDGPILVAVMMPAEEGMAAPLVVPGKAAGVALDGAWRKFLATPMAPEIVPGILPEIVPEMVPGFSPGIVPEIPLGGCAQSATLSRAPVAASIAKIMAPITDLPRTDRIVCLSICEVRGFFYWVSNGLLCQLFSL